MKTSSAPKASSLRASCPLCDRETSHRETGVGSVLRCSACGAVHGSCYKGDSYSLVLPYFDSDPSIEGCVYYDLTLLGSAGAERNHGWFRPSTRKVVQVG